MLTGKFKLFEHRPAAGGNFVQFYYTDAKGNSVFKSYNLPISMKKYQQSFNNSCIFSKRPTAAGYC